jgi:hypothetical protein
MRNKLLLIVAALLTYAGDGRVDARSKRPDSEAQIGCHWTTATPPLAADLNLICDVLQIDDGVYLFTREHNLSIQAESLDIKGEATIQAFPVGLRTRGLPSAATASPNHSDTNHAAETLPGAPGGANFSKSSPAQAMQGRSAGRVSLSAKRASGTLRIISRGEQGRPGYHGSPGWNGGRGQAGGPARSKSFSTPFGNVCYCDAGGGEGGAGGAGGNGGDASAGASGGNGGDVEVAIEKPDGKFRVLTIDVRGGRPGEPGHAGPMGRGGSGGLGGPGACGCRGMEYERRGRDGKNGICGLEASDTKSTRGTPGNVSAGPFALNVVTEDPVDTCASGDGEASRVWRAILPLSQFCAETDQYGRTFLCRATSDPKHKFILSILAKAVRLAALGKRPAHPMCSGTNLEQVGCLWAGNRASRPLGTKNILQIPQSGFPITGVGQFPPDEAKKMVALLLTEEAAHALANHVTLGTLPPKGDSSYAADQLVVDLASLGLGSAYLSVSVELLETLGIIASGWIEWTTNSAGGEAVILSEERVSVQDALTRKTGEQEPINKALISTTFDLSTGTPLQVPNEKDPVLRSIRLVALGDQRLMLFQLPHNDTPVPSDHDRLCSWLRFQGHLSDDGELTSLRFDGLGTGLTDVILANRNAFAGRRAAATLANLLYLAAVTSSISRIAGG